MACPNPRYQFQFTPLREGRLRNRTYCVLNIYFNSRPSARGDLFAVSFEASIGIFQFTPLREGRRCQLINAIIHTYFNSRPSARGDAGMRARRRLQVYFNSRPSARGDLWPSADSQAVRGFQFTPLREGRRLEHARAVVVLIISIHAPPRGATLPFCVLFSCFLYFNSRPSARGDGRGQDKATRVLHFNSRPSARGDMATFVRLPPVSSISIHAPPRGATPTPPAKSPAARYFNSRPSARGDTSNVSGVTVLDISIHAPPRGATPALRKGRKTCRFQFTPLREGRRAHRSSARI